MRVRGYGRKAIRQRETLFVPWRQEVTPSDERFAAARIASDTVVKWIARGASTCEFAVAKRISGVKVAPLRPPKAEAHCPLPPNSGLPMCARYAVADEVLVLTGNADLFAALYELAAKSPTGGIWVEAFGAVRGASIIELTGDRHRESVREATLSALSATVFVKDGVPDIRSVATLTWRDKRTPMALTGFLASARATHLTIRYRPIQLLDSIADSAMATGVGVVSSMAGGAGGASPAIAGEAAEAVMERAVAKITQGSAAKRRQAEQAIVSWADLEDSASDTPPANFGWADLASAVADAEASAPVASAAPSPSMSAPSTSAPSTSAPSTSAPSTESARRVSNASPAATPPPKSNAPPVQTAMSWGAVADASAAQAARTASAASVSSWDQVAQASQEVAARSMRTAQDLERGDVLVHPTLGNCTVLTVVSEHVVMLKPKNDASRKITIKPFDIVDSGKKGVYTLVKRS